MIYDDHHNGSVFVNNWCILVCYTTVCASSSPLHWWWEANRATSRSRVVALLPLLHYSLCLNYLISADAIIHSSPLTQCSFNLRLFDGCSCGISLECNHPSNLSLSSTIKKQVGKVAKDEKETSNRDSERVMKIFTFEPLSIPTALIC